MDERRIKIKSHLQLDLNRSVGAMSDKGKRSPGDGIGSMRATNAFKIINFELYAKPNMVIMSVGLTCFGLALGYIAYMRSKYESMGYYAAVGQDGKEIFEKKKSKWE